VLDAVLFSLVECQESGGFAAYVRMGDYVRYLKVIPVVCFIKGDAKSGDAFLAGLVERIASEESLDCV
jgi:hypothetical protein